MIVSSGGGALGFWEAAGDADGEGVGDGSGCCCCC